MTSHRGPFVPPTPGEVVALGQKLGFQVTAEDGSLFARYAAGLGFAYAEVDALSEWLPRSHYPREAASIPTAEDNPFNAWLCKSAIRGRPTGPLAGKRVAVKDTVAVAGLPLTNGSSLLESHVASHDATVVERVLDAGGEIAGKSVCEYFSYSSGSHTSVSGMVSNPIKPGYSSGGSSSGSAALVAARDVDMAIGGDQAGSIRIPAAHCGVYGLKPTWGLVPYTGAMSSEFAIDHLGPMAATVADCALLLEAIAGCDPLDARTAGAPAPVAYTASLGRSVERLRIGVVAEGFGHAASSNAVDATVRAAANHFVSLGALVEQISLPWHRRGFAIWLVFAMEGYYENMMLGNGFPSGQDGLCWSTLNDAVAGWRDSADDLPSSLKLGILMGEHARGAYRRHYYVKARNLALQLRRAYDEALSGVDVLLMPTTPMHARPLPPTDATANQVIDLAFENIENTCPFNLSHHPALSLPCGLVDGCPIGMMLIARPFEEATLFRAADAFARHCDWRLGGVRT